MFGMQTFVPKHAAIIFTYAHTYLQALQPRLVLSICKHKMPERREFPVRFP